VLPSGFPQFIASEHPIFVGIQPVEDLFFALPFASRDASIRVCVHLLQSTTVLFMKLPGCRSQFFFGEEPILIGIHPAETLLVARPL
jgi:hypothetical protein